jgi:glyoxylase-like metal-dependent hydrolase (beta-lactamase superfamily II)
MKPNQLYASHKQMVYTLTFNPFSENTYIVTDDTKDCIIFDPGCYDPEEKAELKAFIADNGLRPVRLINTHCHLDHVFGNKFVADTWNLSLEIHRGELGVLENYPSVCQKYGVPNFDRSPMPNRFIEADDTIEFGHSALKVLFTPGHSPASLSFYNEKENYVIAGDVLFLESIGRTDLPGGNHATLLESIQTQMFTLPGETIVYPGHGNPTTIRHEKEYNPFF